MRTKTTCSRHIHQARSQDFLWGVAIQRGDRPNEAGGGEVLLNSKRPHDLPVKEKRQENICSICRTNDPPKRLVQGVYALWAYQILLDEG